MIQIFASGQPIAAMIDSGADRCFVTEKTCIENNFLIDPTRRISVVSFDGRSETTIGVTEPVLTFMDEKEEHLLKLQLNVVYNGPAPIVLGKSFLNHRAVVDYVDGEARFFAAQTGSLVDSNNKYKEYKSVAKLSQERKLSAESKESNQSTSVRDERKNSPRFQSVDGENQSLFNFNSASLVNDTLPGSVRKDDIKEDNDLVVREVFETFRELFEDKGVQGFIPGREMQIVTQQSDPICEKVRKMKQEDEREVNLQVERLLKRGVIEHSQSPWGFATVLVTKANGSRRMCVDYRRLNEITVRDSFPIPRMEDLVRKHGRKKVFSALDIKEGFHHLRISEADRPKSAFLTPSGLYHYVGAPFGLKNTPAAYQRVMSNILDPASDCCGVYIDDILISSESENQHRKDVFKVLNLLRENNITLNQQKCNFYQKQVKVLGRYLDCDGLTVDIKKLDMLKSFSFPKSKREMLSFLGMLSYIGNFIPRLADLVMPLRKLVRKASDFVCRSEHVKAFEEVQHVLRSSELRLTFPIDGLQNDVIIHASDASIGACLFQNIENEEKLIDSTSRLLSDCETRYSSIEKQALAVQLAVEKFAMQFGSGTVFVYVTEPALVDITNRRTLPTRLARILLPIQHFEFTIKLKDRVQASKDADIEVSNDKNLTNEPDLSFLIPNVFIDGSCVGNGKDNARASYAVFWGMGHPFNQSGLVPGLATNQRAEVFAAIIALQTATEKKVQSIRIVSDSMYLLNCMTKWCGAWAKNDFKTTKGKLIANLELFQELMNLESKLSVLWQYVPAHAGIYGNDQADQLAKSVLGLEVAHLNSVSLSEELLINQQTDEELQKLRSLIISGNSKKCFVINDDLVCKKETDQLLIVVPKCMRETVMLMYHDSAISGGHLGVSKTYDAIRQAFWWRKLKHDVINYVNSCSSCQLKKQSVSKRIGKLQPLVSTAVMDKVGIDYVGPFPLTARGNRYIIVCVDYFTRYAITKPLPDSTAATTALFLLEEVCCKHGVPKSILSDQGPQFRSRLITELTKLLSIEKSQTAPYSPQCNGLTERVNGTIIRMLKHYVDRYQNNWDKLLPLVTFNYNSKINPTTKFSPFELVTGRQPNTFHKPISSDLSTSEFANQLKERIQVIEEKAKELMKVNQQDMKSAYDETTNIIQFQAGDEILIQNHRVKDEMCSKFTDKFIGPFPVISVFNNDRNCKILRDGKEVTISTSQAKRFIRRDAEIVENRKSENERYDTCIDDILPYVNIICESQTIGSDQRNNPTDDYPNTACEENRNGIDVQSEPPEAILSYPIIDFPNEVTTIEVVLAESDDTTGINSRIVCHICSKRFYSNYNLKRHFKTHGTENQFGCMYCPRVFKTESAKTKHETLPHPLPHICSRCGGGFSNVRELSKHSKVHAGVQNDQPA